MQSEVAIRRLCVEAFRGFRDAQEFNLDASAIIVSGPNGTGKTSFFDAIQWCLTGSLERVASLRAKRTVEHIVNQYRLGERASVELELVSGSNRVILRRSGNHSGSTLELQFLNGARSFGPEAEQRLEDLLLPNGGPNLELALATTGLMQQDVMRAMLQAKPADRYRHVSTVLGLGVLEEFEEATKEAAKNAQALADSAVADRSRAAASLTQAEERLDGFVEQMSGRPSIEALRREISAALSALPAGMAFHPLPKRPKPEDFSRLAAEVGEASARLSRLTSQLDELVATRGGLSVEPQDVDIDEAAKVLTATQRDSDDAQQALAAAQSTLQAVERTASEMSRLAAAAIPQLGHVCPVCGQSIDPAEVEAELRRRADDSAAVMASRDSLARVDSELRAAMAQHESALANHRGLLALRASWDQYWDQSRSFETSVAALRDSAGRVRLDLGDASAHSDIRDRLASFAQALTELRTRLLTALDAIDDSTISADLVRARSEVESFKGAFEARAQRADELTRRSAQIKALSEATVQSRVEVTEERFNAVQPLVADIFSRLDPHPAFKSIEFELDTYYKRGTTSPLVKDVVEDVSADPLVIFSTSQANIAALSYFLAMGWSAGDRSLPFVLLDDPVQSMDDVNVLGFADLSRHIRASRQLVISTHERRFAGLLERKLAPRSPGHETLILEFLGWDRSGPSVTTRRVEPQLLDRPIRVVGAA